MKLHIRALQWAPTAAAAAALLMAGIAPAQADPATSELRAQAHLAFAQQRYAAALMLYERGAAAGDLLAAERAGEMLMGGEAAYGAGVPQDFARAWALLRRAYCNGSASAAQLLDELRQQLAMSSCGNEPLAAAPPHPAGAQALAAGSAQGVPATDRSPPGAGGSR